jgi:hypothetical protein
METPRSDIFESAPSSTSSSAIPSTLSTQIPIVNRSAQSKFIQTNGPQSTTSSTASSIASSIALSTGSRTNDAERIQMATVLKERDELKTEVAYLRQLLQSQPTQQSVNITIQKVSNKKKSSC